MQGAAMSNKGHSPAAQAKRRKAFGRAVAAGHGRKREVTEASLRSRNAYRIAAGLPIIPA